MGQACEYSKQQSFRNAEHWIENTPAFLSPAVIRTSGRSVGACIQSNAVAVIGERWRGHCFHFVF